MGTWKTYGLQPCQQGGINDKMSTYKTHKSKGNMVYEIRASKFHNIDVLVFVSSIYCFNRS